MAISVGANKDALSLSEKLHMYKPFMKMQSAGYADVMRWSDGNYTAELLEPVPADVPGGSDYTGSTFRQTQVTNMNTTLSGYFSTISGNLSASGVKKYVTPEWFTAHSVRLLDIRIPSQGFSNVDTGSTGYGQPYTKVLVSSTKAYIFRFASNNLLGRVVTRTGESWSVGSEQTISTGSWGNDVDDLIVLDTDKVFLVGKNNSNHGRCIVITESGGTFTGGTPAVWSGSNAVTESTVEKIDTDKVFIAYRDTTDTNKNKAICATISVTTITYGAINTFDTSRTASTNFCLASHTANAIVLHYTNSGQGYLYAFTIASTTITAGTEVNIFTPSKFLVALNSSTIGIDRSSVSSQFDFAAYSVSGTTLTSAGSITVSGLSNSTPGVVYMEGGAMYFDVTPNAASRRVYKYTYNAGTFTQVYSRVGDIQGFGANGIRSNWKYRYNGSISSKQIITINTSSTLFQSNRFIFPTLTVQVGTETALANQDVEFQLFVDMKSNYYRKSYISITRTDANTLSAGYTFGEALFETK